MPQLTPPYRWSVANSSRLAPSPKSRARNLSSGSFVLSNGRVAGGDGKEAERRQVAHALPAHRGGPGYRARDHRAYQQLVAAPRIQRLGIYDQFRLLLGRHFTLIRDPARRKTFAEQKGLIDAY